MALLLFILFGFVIGLIARAVMPGGQRMAFIPTALLGMAGSFAGGFIASVLSDERTSGFPTAGLLGSILGALLILFLAGGLFRRRSLI